MNRNIIRNDITGDKIIRLTSPSGLDIYVCEMPGFSSVTAYFAARYGSVNTCFKTAGDSEFTAVPEGIAHYLEHKLFENEDCHAFEKYSQIGASGNAFTGFDITAYTFTCSKNWQEALRILISLVQTPYFTEENVAKEQGIIAQEIKMGSDDPIRKSSFALLEAMYTNNPVRIDQGGTIESIAKITPELLYKCYDAFYNPGNMFLVIAGNVTADQVEEICGECLAPGSDNGLETAFPDEPDTVREKLVRLKLPVGNTFFRMGFKCAPCSGIQQLKKNITGGMLCDLLVASSSGFYRKLHGDGLVNSTFRGDILSGNGFWTLTLTSETDQPEKVCQLILEELERWKSQGIDKALFSSIKKAIYGDMVYTLNNVDRTASLLLNNAFLNVSPYEDMKLISGLTEEDILELAGELTTPGRSSIVIVEGGMNNDNS